MKFKIYIYIYSAQLSSPIFEVILGEKFSSTHEQNKKEKVNPGFTIIIYTHDFYDHKLFNNHINTLHNEMTIYSHMSQRYWAKKDVWWKFFEQVVPNISAKMENWEREKKCFIKKGKKTIDKYNILKDFKEHNQHIHVNV